MPRVTFTLTHHKQSMLECVYVMYMYINDTIFVAPGRSSHQRKKIWGGGGLGAEVEFTGKKPVLPAIKWEERGVPGNLRAKVRSEGG